MLIPKNIYQSWHTKKLHQKVQEHVIDVLKKIILIITEFYTDEEMTNMFLIILMEIVECYDKIDIIVAKVDFWRSQYCINKEVFI